MALVALVIASVLIVVAGAAVARSDWRAIAPGRGAAIERLWVVLPAAFLLVLIALTALELAR